MNQEEWEKFVQEHPDSSFFHQLSWKTVIENAFGFKPHYMVARNEQGIQGILPLFEIKQATGKKLISLPFSTEGGILYKTEKAKPEIILAA